MNEPEQIKDQKLLPPATLTEEDEFYAECNIQGINLVDRVNGKLVRAYPYWIDQPDCNWHSPPEAEDDECFMQYKDDEDEDEDDEHEDEDEGKNNKNKPTGKGLINRLRRLWQGYRQQKSLF